MEINDFVERMKEIKRLGFVPTLRKGPTGVGYTLETMLDIDENNIALPDLDSAELKATRENSSSLITLFTFNKKAWQTPPLEAIRDFGSYDSNGRKGMYYTVTPQFNSANLFLSIDDNHILVSHKSGKCILKWPIDSVLQKFKEKVKRLILVHAKVEERDGREFFFYYKAKLMEDISEEILRNAIIDGIICVDLRLHEKETSARNHGTGFRVLEKNFNSIYTSIKDLGV